MQENIAYNTIASLSPLVKAIKRKKGERRTKKRKKNRKTQRRILVFVPGVELHSIVVTAPMAHAKSLKKKTFFSIFFVGFWFHEGVVFEDWSPYDCVCDIGRMGVIKAKSG